MDHDQIIQCIVETFAGLEVLRPADGPGAGDTVIFSDSEHELNPSHRHLFATIITKDYGNYDRLSHPDRPDVFRLNTGVSRNTLRILFGHLPNEEPPGGSLSLRCAHSADASPHLWPSGVGLCAPSQPRDIRVGQTTPGRSVFRRRQPAREEPPAIAVSAFP